MKRLLILILYVGLFLNAKAQSELTLPIMNDVFQSSYINPTVLPEHTVSIGLPGMSSVYFQAISNGFVPKDFMYFKDSMHVNLNKLVADLKEQNLINANTSVDLLHVRMKIRNGYYWIGVRTNFNLSFMYPKELFSVPIEGTVPYIGKNMDFSNLKIDAMLYNEYSFGMSKEYNRWVFGGRISLLQGLTDLQFNPKSFNMQIDTSTYKVVGNADAQLNTAGIPKDGKGKINSDYFQNANNITNYLTSFKNKGYSLSLGATYKLNDRINFSVAFSDLGYINWKDSVTNYTLKGSSTLPLDIISNIINKKDINVDSIINKFDRDTINKSYRTYLHPKYYLSASYKVFPRTMIGLSASGVYNKKLYPAYTLGVSQGVGRFFNLLATMSYNQRTINNLGVGLMIKPGPFQFYVIADNAYPLINPLYLTNVNVRVGLNFVFGRIKPSIGLPYR